MWLSPIIFIFPLFFLTKCFLFNNINIIIVCMYILFLFFFLSHFFRCKKDSMRWFTLVVPPHIHAKRQKLTKNMWNLSSLFYFILCFFYTPLLFFFETRLVFTEVWMSWRHESLVLFFLFSFALKRKHLTNFRARNIRAFWEISSILFYIFNHWCNDHHGNAKILFFSRIFAIICALAPTSKMRCCFVCVYW